MNLAQDMDSLLRSRLAVLVVDAAEHDAAAPAGAATGAHARVGRCTLSQARPWAGARSGADAHEMPALARRLRAAGAGAVCITGVAAPAGRVLDWLDSAHAQGWLTAAGELAALRTDAGVFATGLEAALARGFVAADAAVIAKMAASAHAGRMSAGDASPGAFIDDPALLPLLSWDERPSFAATRPPPSRSLGLYPLVDSSQRLHEVLAAGVRTVQLRIKAADAPPADWLAMLRDEVQCSSAACRAASAELFVNDHWQLAAELGAHGVHLGQEDLLALGEQGRSALLATGLALGVSSHSLWELCRARALAPRYIACGPVWPTTTKAMPWIPQGPDNLAWWCRMAQAPVVAIGGVLGPVQVYEAARCGADGICMVRGLAEAPQQLVPQLQAALDAGRLEPALHSSEPAWPHPSLPASAQTEP
jgi:hydroxymethylpyrimidine kinase / phosphomethylpyrimidine kinase / thiamine-phosphate diphosphorylase